jgi:hypothetical protein
VCEGSDDEALGSLEIEFNDEHRRRCDFSGVRSGHCIFENIYIGADLRGRSAPIRCTGSDPTGNGSFPAIVVHIE